MERHSDIPLALGRLGNVVLLYKLYTVFALLLLCFAAPPTLDDITKKSCPIDKPYKCLPYGKCYGVESYCHLGSGTVQSCFSDSELTEDKKKSWCREYGHNVTYMKDETCSLACSSIFLADVSNLINNLCPDANPHVCPPDGHCYNSSQYCQQGMVRSCFPKYAMSDLLNWCRNRGQYNVSLMEHKSCYLACQTKFSTADLSHSEESINIVLLIALIIAVIFIFVGPIICWKLKRNKKIQKWYRKLRRSKAATGSGQNQADTFPDNTEEIPVKRSEARNLLKLDISKPVALLRQNSKPSSPLSPKSVNRLK